MNILLLIDLPAENDERIRQIAPGAKIHRVDPKSEDVAKYLADAEIVVGFPKTESLENAGKLKWVQLGSAGADRFYDSMPPEVILTNASGTYGKCIAEHILAMMLSLTRGIAWMVRAQSRNQWERQFRWVEVSGATMGIIGLGDIGLETARRAKALEMHVLANKRTPEGKPDFVDELYGLEGLEQILNRSDHVVVTVPGVPSTREMMGPAQFAAMKNGAYFYNVGRGSTVDEAALIEALKSGKLAGAGLDVFQQEPLEQDSPLWQMENVILSPHVGGSTQYGARRIGEIFLENLSRYTAGQEMINVVDRTLGY